MHRAGSTRAESPVMRSIATTMTRPNCGPTRSSGHSSHRELRSRLALRLGNNCSRAAEAGAVIRRRVVAHGQVQGVFFRDSCRREARAHRVSGWVTNREDGAVEAVFEGDLHGVQAL